MKYPWTLGFILLSAWVWNGTPYFAPPVVYLVNDSLFVTWSGSTPASVDSATVGNCIVLEPTCIDPARGRRFSFPTDGPLGTIDGTFGYDVSTIAPGTTLTGTLSGFTYRFEVPSIETTHAWSFTLPDTTTPVDSSPPPPTMFGPPTIVFQPGTDTTPPVDSTPPTPPVFGTITVVNATTNQLILNSPWSRVDGDSMYIEVCRESPTQCIEEPLWHEPFPLSGNHQTTWDISSFAAGTILRFRTGGRTFKLVRSVPKSLSPWFSYTIP